MQCTDFGKTGLKVSRFGLGTMRLPADEKAAVEIVRYAIDHGVNYIDTAYIYAGSEELLGKALADGYREKVTLVTKCPVIYSQSHADFEKFLDEQLRRLKVDYVDVYMLHNLSPGVWEKVKKYDGIPFLEEMRKKGKIRFKPQHLRGLQGNNSERAGLEHDADTAQHPRPVQPGRRHAGA